MNPEPGWYYADGDPEDTVRLWNGTAWVGFPQRDPSTVANQGPEVTPFKLTPGQVGLRPLAVLAQIFLTLAIVALGYLIYQMYRSLAVLDRVDPVFGVADEQQLIDMFGPLLSGWILYGAATSVAGIFFVLWMWTAYRNINQWHNSKHSTGSAIWSWFVPFMNLFRPIGIMLELLEHSPRKDRAGELNPVKAIAWWALWILPGLVGGGLSYSRPNEVDALRNFVTMQIVMYGLTMISGVIALVLVQQITDHQESRRRPSAAQVELFQEDGSRASSSLTLMVQGWSPTNTSRGDR